MKLLTATFIAATMLAPVQTLAEEPSSEEKTTCESIHELASLIMWHRQHGTSIVEAMELAGDAGLSGDLIKMAYRRDKRYTEKSKKEAQTEFANAVYLVCEDE